MIRSATAAFALNLFLALPADAETWRDGFGQGVAEAWVDKDPGNRIYVACEAGWGRPITGISFMLAGRSPEPNSTITLIFDARDPIEVTVDKDGKVGSNCRACAGWFEFVRDKLKSSASVYVRFSEAAGTRFSLKGAANAIGECKADFWKMF